MQMHHHSLKKLSSTMLFIALSSVLAACGGGGGGGSDNSATAIDTTQLKGRWVTASGVTPAVTAVVVPEASGTANAWLLAQDASRLVKLVVRSDGSTTGKSYALSQGNATGQAVTGQVTAALTSTPKSISFTGVNAGVIALSLSDALAAPAVQADAEGTWRATLGGNAQTIQWSVAATGALSGSATSGCSYTGGISAIASTAAYSVQLNESCPDGTKTAFGGIATLNASKSGLTVVLASADEARGAAVFFSK